MEHRDCKGYPACRVYRVKQGRRDPLAFPEYREFKAKPARRARQALVDLLACKGPVDFKGRRGHPERRGLPDH